MKKTRREFLGILGETACALFVISKAPSLLAAEKKKIEPRLHMAVDPAVSPPKAVIIQTPLHKDDWVEKLWTEGTDKSGDEGIMGLLNEQFLIAPESLYEDWKKDFGKRWLDERDIHKNRLLEGTR